jgi:hypothetical protein
MLNTGLHGHWFSCGNNDCNLKIPLPDYIFINREDHKINENIKMAAECKCGFMNFFSFSQAESETKKPEVDKYFDIKDQRLRINAYWEGQKEEEDRPWNMDI